MRPEQRPEQSEPPPVPIRIWPLIVAVAVLAVFVLIVIAAGSLRAVPAPAPSAAASAASTAERPAPVSFQGQGSRVLTAHLVAGRYRAIWAAQGNDNFIVTVHGSKDVLLVNEVPPSPASGEAFLSVSETGDYPIEVKAATLAWTLTFAPI